MTSRKIYIEFAKMLRRYCKKYHPSNNATQTQTLIAIGGIITDTEKIFENDNPNFDHSKFIQAIKQ